jgi:hypothetical protein
LGVVAKLLQLHGAAQAAAGRIQVRLQLLAGGLLQPAAWCGIYGVLFANRYSAVALPMQQGS